MNKPELTPEEIADLRQRCFRSPAEFGRVFLPNWFPLKMPWFHRGILALITGKTEFLLDFGPERWRDEKDAEWTPDDLEKILSNFVVQEVANDPNSPVRPVFDLTFDEQGNPQILILEKKNKVAVILPRGYAKTTIVNMANLRSLAYKEINYPLYVSEAAEHANDQLETVKLEFEDNALLQAVFGVQQPPRQGSLRWGSGLIELLNGTRMRVAGKGGQIRGKAKRAQRPDRILVDDMEDEESVQSPTQRTAYSKWFFGTLEPAVKKGGQIIMIGTLLAGSGTILNKLERNEEYVWIRFGAIDRQGEALWPYGNGLTLEELEKKKAVMTAMGELQSFYLEYMSIYVDDEARIFPAGKQIFISKPLERFASIALACDPAIGQKTGPKGNDFCAFAVVGMEPGGTKHVIHAEGEQAMDPAEQVEKFFELHWRFMVNLPPDRRKYGVESIAYQRALAMSIRSAQFAKSREVIKIGPYAGQIAGQMSYFEVEQIMHGIQGKDQRIKGILKPIYHNGYLTFERSFPELDEQLLEYPSGKKDFPDVVAMAIKLLDPYAALHVMGEEGLPVSESLPPLPSDFGRYAS